jgi:hypothetical protein
MGEARRRKLAGEYPDPKDGFEALRRFWCGRDPGPAEDFVAPVGTVAITFSIEGVPPSTCMIDASKIVDAMDRVTEIYKGLSYYSMVRAIGREFTKARNTSDKCAFEWLGLAGVWTCFNHPQSGTAMRKAVSTKLRHEGKAHITWNFGSGGLGVALADKFVDLDGLAARAPKDQVTIYSVVTGALRPVTASVRHPRHVRVLCCAATTRRS